MIRRRQAFRPFATRGRRTITGILATFALFSTLTVTVASASPIDPNTANNTASATTTVQP